MPHTSTPSPEGREAALKKVKSHMTLVACISAVIGAVCLLKTDFVTSIIGMDSFSLQVLGGLLLFFIPLSSFFFFRALSKKD